MEQIKKQLQQLTSKEREEIAFWLFDELLNECGVRPGIKAAKELSIAKQQEKAMQQALNNALPILK